MEDINQERRNFISLLNLDMVPRNSIPGGFAYIWQSKWVGIITIKTERTKIHFFLRDVLVEVALLGLKIPTIQVSFGFVCFVFLVKSSVSGSVNMTLVRSPPRVKEGVS